MHYIAAILLLGVIGALAALASAAISKRSSRDSSSDIVPPERRRQSTPRDWLADRSQVLNAKLDQLLAQKDELAKLELWRPIDQRRLERVLADLQDYLDSANEQLDQNRDAYLKLFQDGPFTTVPHGVGMWSMAWGVWMVDAHIDLLSEHAKARLEQHEATDEERQHADAFVAECEKCIAAAGLDREGDAAPQYRLTNAVRTVTGKTLVRFDETPFGLPLADALALARVADQAPDVGAFLPDLKKTDPATIDFKEVMEQYKQARDAAWRPLTDDEKSAVTARMATA